MNAALSINVMGSFAIHFNGETLAIKSLPRRKVRSLLKLLALEPNHALPRDTLIEHLWSDLDPTAAAAQLYNALYSLRKVLGDAVAPKLISGMVRLEPEGGLSVDAATFGALARDGLAKQDAAKLFEAANFIDGLPISEDLYEDWASSYREDLLGLQTRVLETLAGLDISKAEFAWQKLLQLEPTSESANLGLIAYFAQTGQPNLATEQFERYRRILTEELGAEPTAKFSQAVTELLQSSQPRQKAVRQALPAPTVPLVGREAELTMLHHFFEDTNWRLLTILGLGGNGKTRLALEAAWNAQNQFSDGVFWVPLENLSSQDDPNLSALQALGLTPPNSQAETVLFDYLKDKQCLLVLDNLEHLPEIGHWVQRLLSAAAKIKVLATSRSTLQLQSEHILELHGLSFEAASTLFVQSATRVKPAFVTSEKTRQQIALLTEHLAGSPLAIELAASWVRHMNLEEIAQEVQLDLDFLERPVKDRETRHHSVRAVFDSSWRLLEPPEQQTLVSLAVFIGEFTLAAARAVSGASRAAIVALTDRSLLNLRETRLELHPLLRQFVLEKANQEPEGLAQTRQAHATHFLEQLQALPARYRTKDLEAYLETKRHVDVIYQNTRAAWQWALDRQQFEVLNTSLDGFFVLHQLGDRLVEISALLPEDFSQTPYLPARFAAYRGTTKFALGQFKEAENDFLLAIPKELSIEQQVQRLCQLSSMYSRTARVPQALNLAQEALEIAKTTNLYMQSLSHLQLHDVLAIQGNYEEAQIALEAAREGANVRIQSFITIQAATLAGRKGQLEQAEFELRQAQKLLTQLGDSRNLQVVQNNLATALQLQGKYLESLEILETSANQARFLGDQRMLAVILNSHMVSLRALGQYEQALQAAQQNLELCQRTGNTLRTAYCLARMGTVYFELKQFIKALECYQASVRLEVSEAREESTIGLIRTLIALGQVEEARAQIENTDLKGKVFAAWKAIFTIQLGHEIQFDTLHQRIQNIFTLVQDISALNACECLSSILGIVHTLEPAFTQQLASSLVQDPCSSDYARNLAQPFLGDSTSLFVPWQQVLEQWLVTREDLA